MQENSRLTGPCCVNKYPSISKTPANPCDSIQLNDFVDKQAFYASKTSGFWKDSTQNSKRAFFAANSSHKRAKSWTLSITTWLASEILLTAIKILWRAVAKIVVRSHYDFRVHAAGPFGCSLRRETNSSVSQIRIAVSWTRNRFLFLIPESPSNSVMVFIRTLSREQSTRVIKSGEGCSVAIMEGVQYCGGFPILWRVYSTMEDVRYFGKMPSVLFGNTSSTVVRRMFSIVGRYHQYCRGIPSVLWWLFSAGERYH